MFWGCRRGALWAVPGVVWASYRASDAPAAHPGPRRTRGDAGSVRWWWYRCWRVFASAVIALHMPEKSHLTAEKVDSKDTNETEVRPKKRRKKKISDILAKSSPKPGTPADLQKLLNEHFGAKRSLIELEELKLPDACFLPANDLTHSFSSYLKEICPKWAKFRKNHTEKKSVVMLIICSSALRCLALIKSMAAFKAEGRVMKMFAKHIKIQDQMKMLENGTIHVGVGTPGRIKALVEQDGLSLTSLKYLVLDWNWRDQKLRRLVDIPEIKKETIELLEMGLIKLCREGSVKLGLF